MHLPLIHAIALDRDRYRTSRRHQFGGSAPALPCAINQAVPFHAFTDETKERRYVMVAAILAPSHLSTARSAMRSLILPRQRRIHLHKESDARRKQILDAVVAFGTRAIVYDGGRFGGRYKAARDACLARMVTDLVALGVERFVLETEEGTLKSDRRLISGLLRDAGSQLPFYHLLAKEECLLGVPDAIAWSWARGGHWRRRVEEIVDDVRRA
ncbi:hypothetical protein [Phytohabitans aurantiacus]|uniref:hypothetical protein n=1 Tax=Phytohabitans aurantiacus TaxID=3016789 RepID=UPI0024914E71|nr:hypothetical protein [Phytohabitans aurantiacus]